ncbi:MAG: PhoD-like phosphatase N-terminal domain-containing protein, partial [Pseudomonadales bacterium]|nr:PhoD-like phosphatase N-terminal domain-containing protein [Pseudomonadales bacterium]
MINDYSRRKFLKTVVISAGAVGAGGLSGCGGDSTEIEELIEITRSFNPSIFPQSVVSGDPKASSIILWTRVANGSGEQRVGLQVSRDQDFQSLVAETWLTAKSSSDHCVKVKVTDLNSYTTYYYRFVTDGYSSRTGRFKTAPSASQNQDIKFGFTSCQDYTNG